MSKSNQKALQAEKVDRARQLGRAFSNIAAESAQVLAALAGLATGKRLPKYARDAFSAGALERELEIDPFNPESVEHVESESDKQHDARVKKAEEAHNKKVAARIRQRVKRAYKVLERDHGITVELDKRGGAKNAAGGDEKAATREATRETVDAIRSAEAPDELPPARGVKKGKALPGVQESVDALAAAIVSADEPKDARNLAWGSLERVAAFLGAEI